MTESYTHGMTKTYTHKMIKNLYPQNDKGVKEMKNEIEFLYDRGYLPERYYRQLNTKTPQQNYDEQKRQQQKKIESQKEAERAEKEFLLRMEEEFIARAEATIEKLLDNLCI